MNSETDESLAGRIRRCAEIAGSGDELARRSDTPRRTLEYYLTGQREPKASRLVAIADAAGVTVEWLVSGRGAMFPQAIDFDRELFSDCWSAVEEIIEEMGKRVSREKRIELVFAVYDLQVLEREEGRQGVNVTKIIRLVRSAA